MKRRFLYRCFSLAFLLWQAIGLRAAESLERADILFQNLSLKEGLSYNTVYDVKQDDQGYLWIGTGNGLNRYDGRNFVVFRNEQNDSCSIMNNTIWTIYQQNADTIWLGTNNGLSLYDKRKNKFTNFPYQEERKKLWITSILKWVDGLFILSTNRGVYTFSMEKGYKKTSLPYYNTALFRLDKRSILVGTSDGVFYYYPETNTSESVDLKLKGIHVAVIVRHHSSKDRIWLGTEGRGLLLYHLKDGTIEQIIRKGNRSNDITSDFIRSLCYDDRQQLWIGTLVGLNVLDEATGRVRKYLNTGVNESEISQNSVKTILRDNQGGMWCGTYYGGLNYYHPLRNRFSHIFHTANRAGLNSNIISVIKEDSRGRIWIGTNEAGINIYHPVNGSFHYLKNKEESDNSLNSNDVKAIQEDRNGIFYIGTRNGLCRYLSGSNTFESIRISNNAPRENRVYALYKREHSDSLWVGLAKGLYVYHTKSKAVSSFRIKDEIPLSEYEILSLLEDSKNGLWIGTNFGFFRYDIKKEQLYRCNAIENDLNLVYCFLEDKDGKVWIGGNDGLYCYDPSAGKLDAQFMKIGFPSFVICGIEEDSSGNLWISTSGEGLIMLNRHTYKWRTYTEPDGIQSNQFSPRSHCKTHSGEMYFGGINGISVFTPEKIMDNPYTPEPVINRLTVFNKTVHPGDETNILDQTIDRQIAISLPPKYNVFGLSFAAMNFLAGKQIRYAYKLEGFDADWYQTENNVVSYSNLRPGKYLFRLKAANDDNKWSKRETVLTIIILPFWYETWQAKLLFVVALAIVIFVILHFYFSRKLIADKLKMEQANQEWVRQMDQAKIQFFVNISHEFRTPLTLIISPIRDILDRGIKDRWLVKQLKLIERNAGRMFHLINQVLDSRKTEFGAIPLQVVKSNLEEYTRSHFGLFDYLARQKGIDYRFISELKNPLCWFDPNFLDRVLNNLLGNAFKYTEQGGKIQLTLYNDGRFIVIEVADSGCGILPKNQQKVFDRFYQEEENSQGTGIGLSLVKTLVEQHHGSISLQSEPGKGSVFTVRLPSETTAYSSKEIKAVDTVLQEIGNDKLSDTTFDDVSGSVLHFEKEQEDTKTIMLVEDDEDIRTYLSDQLSASYCLLSAKNGKEAWETLKQNNLPDLIISDVMMPVMDGLTLCKMVKQNINLCHIPFIMLTAKNEVESQLKGLRCGADDYIGKPFFYSVLEMKVNTLFRRQQLVIKKYLSNPECRPDEIITNNLDKEFLLKAQSIVEKNLDNSEFSVDEFGKELCMSRSNLHLKFKAITGESAGDFIRKVRMSNAVRLLKEGRYSMTEISIMVGMTPAYFSTLFKKHHGCIPSEFIRKSAHN